MNYYNEFEPKIAVWLKELIQEGLIPNGEVDTRNISEVQPRDLMGFTQCHFFAGIGGWAYALQLSGWGGDRPVWTGSCPCQPYSVAGKREGKKDHRDVWPYFFRLIKECRPDTVFGEQVASAIGFGWLDGICSDLEAEDYAVGSVVLGAHSINAPHIRQRLYWVSDTAKHHRVEDTTCVGWGGWGNGNQTRNDRTLQIAGYSPLNRMADAVPQRQHIAYGLFDSYGTTEGAQEANEASGESRENVVGERKVGDSGGNGQPISGVSYAQQSGLEGYAGDGYNGGEPRRDTAGEARPASQNRNSYWGDSIAILCRDGKYRRIPASSQSILQCVADGVPYGVDESGAESVFPLSGKVGGRVLLLKGYGNAIVPQLASEFIATYMGV